MSATQVKPYARLRDDMARRDRGLHEKVTTLEEAASRVTDGMSVGIGGSTMSRTPMALIWQLIRQGTRDLTCSRSIMSTEGDLLYGSGASRHVITSWFAQGILFGLSKVMRHHIEKQGAAYDEWSHMAMGMRFRAGGMGVPYLPTRVMMGSDVLTQRASEAKQTTCPFTGEDLLLVPALNPDVALIHVQRCDAYGNAQIDSMEFMDIDLALAADRVILTTERVVSNAQIRRTPHLTRIPFFCVDAVVEVPFGAAPHECYGCYEPMMKHMSAYVAQVNADPVEGMRAYLDRYFHQPESWTDYLQAIGLAEILDARRSGRSIYND